MYLCLTASREGPSTATAFEFVCTQCDTSDIAPAFAGHVTPRSRGYLNWGHICRWCPISAFVWLPVERRLCTTSDVRRYFLLFYVSSINSLTNNLESFRVCIRIVLQSVDPMCLNILLQGYHPWCLGGFWRS